MTGYCGKDDVPGNNEFRCYLINVSAEDYAKGKAFYATGAGPNLKILVMLDRRNILHKAYMYARLTARGETTDLVSILLAILLGAAITMRLPSGYPDGMERVWTLLEPRQLSI